MQQNWHWFVHQWYDEWSLDIISMYILFIHLQYIFAVQFQMIRYNNEYEFDIYFVCLWLDIEFIFHSKWQYDCKMNPVIPFK